MYCTLNSLFKNIFYLVYNQINWFLNIYVLLLLTIL